MSAFASSAFPESVVKIAGRALAFPRGIGSGTAFPSSASSAFPRESGGRNFPSQRGLSARMRSSSGGCVAKSAFTPFAKKKCANSPARGELILLPSASPPMRESAFASASGLRVNCVADASARRSRLREIAAWTSCAKMRLTKPITSKPSPSTMKIAAGLPLPERRPPDCHAAERRKISPRIEIITNPKIQPVSRIFSRMSPLRMCEYSCPTTACNSSRESLSSAPRETAIAARFFRVPAANALIPSSFSRTKMRGTGTPDASDISCTTLTSRRSSAASLAGEISRPPSCFATSAPVESASSSVLQKLAPPTIISVPAATKNNRSGSQSSGVVPAASQFGKKSAVSFGMPAYKHTKRTTA